MEDQTAMTDDDPTAPFAAAVYTPKQSNKSALPDFVARLKSEKVVVAGILQEAHLVPGDKSRTIESVDIITGNRIPIKRPMKSENECGLDVSSLVETSAVLQRALSERPDLVVIEKYGDQEQIGKGLMDEIMAIIADDIPLIIAVPEPALDIWEEQTGSLGSTVAFVEEDLYNWWTNLSDKPS